MADPSRTASVGDGLDGLKRVGLPASAHQRLGLTPREYSSGGHRQLGHISKRGDRYLRCLLIHGGRAVVLAAARRRRTGQPLSRLHRWALQVRDRCHFNLAIVAVANKLARLVWAVWTRDTAFVAA